MNLIIRKATKGDYIDISKLTIEVHKLHQVNRPDVYLEVKNPLNRDYFESLISRSNTKLFVVEETTRKELLAYCMIQVMITQNPIYAQTTFVYIDDFCVKSCAKRSGIGSMLFNHITAYAKSVNAASIQLNVWEFNQDALGFYEKMGMSTRNRRMELSLDI